MNKSCVLATILSCLAAVLPASADNGQGTGLYNNSYGGGRVCRMHSNGLVGDAGRATYIGSGTLSQTAQGKNPIGANLPSTSWGGTIRSPGDGLYNGNDGTVREANGAVNYRDNVMRREMAQRAMMERRAYEQWLRSGGAQQAQRQWEMQRGNYYQPGSNGGVSSYSSGGGTNYRYNNGTASYGSYGR